MDGFSGITSFVRVADELSFSAAARSLSISASAVGKNVAKLEHRLGARLFQRSTRRVSLTDEGRVFYERCERILADLREAETELTDSGRQPRGSLRVSLPAIGYRFLMPIVPEFRRRYPGIDLDLDFSDRLVDLIEDGFDVAIRGGTLDESSLVSRRIEGFAFVIAGSPSYLDRRGEPRAMADLAGHDAVRFRVPRSGQLQPWPIVCAKAEPATALVCGNMEAVRAAAIAGIGLACMPDFLARDALAAGELRTVMGDDPPPPGQFSILWPSSRQMSPRLRAFVDFVCAEMFVSEP